MDLHIVGADPTDEERSAADALLGPPETFWEGGTRQTGREGRTAAGGREISGQRDLLLPAFHAVQDRVGWISRGALNYICRRLNVPPAEAWGVVTFYHLLATDPRPAVVAHVCDDIACRLHGADRLCEDLQQRLGASVHRSPCLGQCEHGSAALITRAGKTPERFVLAPIKPDELSNALSVPKAPKVPEVPRVGAYGAAKLLRRIGHADPTSLESYRKHGGYQALKKAIEIGADAVIKEVTTAKLLGRGGAAFPTGRKWDAVSNEQATPHYVVCNADESEPGTFKDRVIMTDDPFALVEAMTICGLATGSERGFLYIRGEYPLAESRTVDAIGQAIAAGLLGANILGSGFAFDIEVRRGGGAYICGEETALFNSIEGKRGEPRSKPPYPAQVGVFGKPTAVNNVETLVNVLDILLEGGQAWARIGTSGSTGTRLFCLSGHVAHPGLYEIPCGRSVRDAITLAGGVPGGKAIKAILLGGAAGTFVGPDALDMPLSFEGARAANATLGSGVIMVFDETADLVDALARIAEFFRHESCGQCVPCRVGTVRQQELLSAASKNGATIDGKMMTVLNDLSQAMRDASICGLGHTASAALDSAIANLPVFRSAS